MAWKKPPGRPWQRSLASLSATLTLASWRWRQQWLLLLITGVGMLSAIVLVCSLPLFSSIMTTAGLRNVLRAEADSAQIVSSTSLPGLSSRLVNQADEQVDSQVHRLLGTYLQDEPRFALSTPAWPITTPGQAKTPTPALTLAFYGVPIASASKHIHLLQGRLPTDTGFQLEILLTTSEARYLGNVQVGTNLTIQGHFLTAPGYTSTHPSLYVQSLTARVAGIFQADASDVYWHGQTFSAQQPHPGVAQAPFVALTNSNLLFNVFNKLAQEHQANGVFTSGNNANYGIYLTYTLNTAQITGNDLDDLIARLYGLQQAMSRAFNANWGGYNPQPPYIQGLTLSGPTLDAAATAQNNASTLEKFRNQELVARMPALLLTGQITCLILFFISVMAGALVERQSMAIAVMRSRGASHGQILGSLLIQSMVLCLLTGLGGPPLALGLATLLAPRFLVANVSDALNTLALHPWQTFNALSSFTLAALVATLLTTLFTLILSTRANVVTQRREGGRTARRPLWQQLQLDQVCAVLALASYSFALYVESTGNTLNAPAQTLISAPLALLAPLLVLIAGMLFFVRLFPALLRLCARSAQRGNGLSSMLALAQMARAPRQPMRQALLLGLATAFAIFSLVFSASQAQRGQDLATYQAGSDFSGFIQTLPPVAPGEVLTAQGIANLYQPLRGVRAVSAGYRASVFVFASDGGANSAAQATVLQAVDAGTFAQAVRWTAQSTGSPLTTLMARLVEERSSAIDRHVVPALVAASTWQLLGLHPGATFHLSDDQGHPKGVTYLALAAVAHVPPVDDSSQGALLVDYPTLASVSLSNHETLAPNYIWIRSSDKAADITSLRLALARAPLALTGLVDRRALVAASATDPLVVNLITLLDVGVITALMLAFLANILLPLLSVHTRLAHFAVLRALGTGPAQVTRMLAWEQGIVLLTSLLLGLSFGALLVWAAVPPLIFAGTAPASARTASDTAIFTLQHMLPVTLIIPPTLALALSVLLALCLLALILTTCAARRPLLAHVLRLNED